MSDTRREKPEGEGPLKIRAAREKKKACVKTDLAFVQVVTFGSAQWCYGH